MRADPEVSAPGAVPIHPETNRPQLARLAARAGRIAGRGARLLGVELARCAALLTALLVLLGFAVYRGALDLSASAPVSAPAALLFDAALRQAVAAHAPQGAARFPDTAEVLRRGAVRYRQSCEACHRGPGVTRAKIADALSPAPADLSMSASRWSEPELFWIVRNGVRMSAMPAWRGLYTDAEIRDIVALVAALPRLSAAEYADLRNACTTGCDEP